MEGVKVTSEQWQQVQELFEAALERGPAERTAFVAQACGSDEGVREEVESLLAGGRKHLIGTIFHHDKQSDGKAWYDQ